MKKVLDFIVYSNLFISVCCAALTLQTAYIFLETEILIHEYVLINFIATFCLYNLQRLYYSSKQEGDVKYFWYARNRKFIFTLIVLLLLVSFNFLLDFFIKNKSHLIVYSLLASLSLLYFLPPLQLKKYGILKPFLIGFVFVVIAILIPLNFIVTQQILLYTLGQFFFISALCILFDIRDVVTDKEKNINTFPVLIGLKNSKIIILILCSCYLILNDVLWIHKFILSTHIIFCISCIVTIISNPKKNNYFYLIVVDGLLLLQAVIIVI